MRPTRPEPGREGAPPQRPSPILTHSRRLGELVSFHTFVGLLMGGVIVLGALVARYVVQVDELDVGALVILGLTIVGYNTIAWSSTKRYRDPEASIQGQQRLLRTMYGTIVLDYIVLTIAIWLVGGTRSPFLPFYLLHVILSCLLLSRRAALFFHMLAYAFLVALVLGEWLHWFPPPHMPHGAVAGNGPLDGRYVATVLAVYGVLFGLTAFLLFSVARTFRKAELRLRGANAELERLSAMRRDFLRIALHNLQSPVGVVTMFLNNIRGGLGGPVTEKQFDWIDRSLARLQGVKAFMHDLQMLSTLESGRLDARAEEIDIANMLADVVAEHQDLANTRGQTLELEAPGALPVVRGIELLVRESVVNYITNAVKYSHEGGRITVRVESLPPFVRIEVEDEGEGITEEDQARLFGEFVRVKHGGAAKAKGTGLGLSIVKRVAEVHGGSAGVDSELTRGSRFFLELPSS